MNVTVICSFSSPETSMKKSLVALVALLIALTSSVTASAAGFEPERSSYQKDGVRLIVMLARDDCCAYVNGLEAAGWVQATARKKARFTCYLTIGEVDMALACYRDQEKGRIGTRVVETNPNECSTDTLRLLIGAGISNIIRDFQKNGYPDGCTAAGCLGGSGGSLSD